MRVVITGASGFLGSVCTKLLVERSESEVIALRSPFRRSPLSAAVPEVMAPPDLNPQSLRDLLSRAVPTHILHCGALSSPEVCEKDPELAMECNYKFTQMLAAYATESGIHLTTVSTDLVFDGAHAPTDGLVEGDPVKPLSVYAQSKSAAERATLAVPHSAVVRLSLLYGYSPSGSLGPLGWMERALKDKRHLALFEDEFRTPLHVYDAAGALLDLLKSASHGVWHCGGPKRLSRFDFGREVANSLGYDQDLIVRSSRLSHATPPARPEDVSLNSNKLSLFLGRTPRPVGEAMAIYPSY